MPMKTETLEKAKTAGFAVFHVIAAAKLIAGIALTLFGIGLWNLGWSGGGGVPPMIIIVGAVTVACGASLTLYVAIVWVFGSLVQLLGWKKVAGILAVVFAAGSLITTFVPFDRLSPPVIDDNIIAGVLETPVPAAIKAPDEVTIRAADHRMADQIAVLSSGAEVDLLEISELHHRGYFWFRIAFNDGEEGYVLGSSLCATSKWVNGLAKVCANRGEVSDQQSPTPDRLLLDKIELAYELLLGDWSRLSANSPRLTFDASGRFYQFPDDGTEGYWSVVAVDESQSATGVAIKYFIRGKQSATIGVRMGSETKFQPIVRLDPSQLTNREPNPDGSQIRFGRQELYPTAQ